MSVAILQPRHCFGFKPNVRNAVHWLDAKHILYPAGHLVVVLNTDTRAQRFIHGAADSEAITALAVSPNGKHLAVAESAPPPERSGSAPAGTGAEAGRTTSTITIYDLATLKRRKSLSYAEAGSPEYVWLHFSPDSRLLLAQSGAPEWMLVLWVWDKARVGSVIKSAPRAVLSCLFCPSDPTVVSVLSSNMIKMLRQNDTTLKNGPQPLAKGDAHEFCCQAWVPGEERDRLVLGTAAGEVLVLDGLDLRTSLHIADDAACECLLPFSRGFLAGGRNGALSVFQPNDSDGFNCTHVFRPKDADPVACFAVAPRETQLAVASATGALYTFALGQLEILKTDLDHFEPLLGMQMRNAEITGLSTCVRKPLVATCSLDKAVRLWNWQDLTLEVCKYFQDEGHSISLHPHGLFVLVGFTDKLRLLGVLVDDMKVYHEIGIKQCREVRFSQHGHSFAAVNGTFIQVYHTLTCECFATLRGHSARVSMLCWTEGDRHLVSVGRDGALYEWRVEDGKREKEHVLKGCHYVGAAVPADCGTLYATGSDMLIKELEEHPQLGTRVKTEQPTGESLTGLVAAKALKVLFAGANSGAVHAFKLPFGAERQRLRVHCGRIAAVSLFHDDSLLFSAGCDGMLLMLSVRSDARAALRRESEKLAFIDEVLVAKSDMEERRSKLAETEMKLQEQVRQNQLTVHVKDLEAKEQVAALTTKFSAEAASSSTRYELLQQQKVEAELEFAEQLKALEEKKLQQLAALDSQYQAKLMQEVDRYRKLLQEKELLNSKWDEQNAVLVEAHERVVSEITEELEAKLAEEQAHLQELQQQKQSVERAFDEERKQLEEDTDREIEGLKQRYETKLGVEKQLAVTLKGENALLRKRFTNLEKSIEEQKAEIQRLNEAQETLYKAIATHERDVHASKEEIRARDASIADKEKRIYDLKRKNQELDKFKFVLDHKISELKKQMEPKDEAISDMKDQIKEMDQELERYHKANARLELMVSDVKVKYDSLRSEWLTQRHMLSQKDTNLQQLQHDLHAVAQVVQDPKDLKEKVKAMYQKHINSPVTSYQIDDGVLTECYRQREYLEGTVKSLKGKLETDMHLHRTDNLRIMHENVALIREINELRREIKMCRSQAASAAGLLVKPQKGGAEDPGAEKDLIRQLREEIRKKDVKISELEGHVLPRPVSRERLTPMDTKAVAMQG